MSFEREVAKINFGKLRGRKMPPYTVGHPERSSRSRTEGKNVARHQAIPMTEKLSDMRLCRRTGVQSINAEVMRE